MTGTLQAPSLVEKAERVQLRFTPRLRDQWSMWMQDGCKLYMDSYIASNGSCFMVTWTTFKDHLLEVGRTQNRETMTLQTFTTVGLFYSILSYVRTRMNRNSLNLHLVEHMVTYDFTLHLRVGDHPTWFWRCLGSNTCGHFLLGSHNSMVTALGSCVKWPSVTF
jgi:hypothetical protein